MPVLLVPLFVPLLFFLPGYFFIRLFFREPNALTVGERLFIPVAVSVCVTGWIALTLAELGVFSIWALAGIVLALCMVVWRLGRNRIAAWSIRDLKPDWIFLATFGLALFLFAHPAEYIIGNSDAGTYVNTGANIARTGAIAIHDAQVAQLPLDSAKTFYWQLVNPYMLYRFVRLPGFFIADPAQGLVLPQFLHLYPAWLAIWDALLGVSLGLYATPIIALLGSIAFYFLVRQLFGKNLARLAFFLLVVTVPQFWFARYPVAEGMTQFLVLTGMWAMLAIDGGRTTTDRRPSTVVRPPSVSLGLPILAGLALGEIFLARADAVLLLLPLFIYGLVLSFGRKWQRAHWAMFGAFGVVFARAIVHMLIFSPDYFYYQYTHVLRTKNIDRLFRIDLPGAQAVFGSFEYALLLVGLVVAGVVVLFIADRLFQVLWKRFGAHIESTWLRSEKWLRVLGALGVVTLFIFAYFIWARPETLYAFVGGQTPLESSANFIKLGWYLSPIAIVLAALGAVIVLLRDLNARNAFFFATAALFSFFYLEDLYSNPHYIYTTRHYIPLVIPLFIILAARGLQWLWNPAWLKRFSNQPRLRTLARIGAGSAFALWMLYNLYAMGIFDASRANGFALRLPFVSQSMVWASFRLEPFENSIAGTNELGGAYQQIQTLAQGLDPNAVVIFSGGRDEPATIATPLRYIFGRDAFVTVFNNPPGEKVAAMIDSWRAQGRDVILAYGTNGGKLQIPNYALQPLGDFSLDVPQWAFAYDFMPRSAWRVNLNYALFRAVPGSAPEQYPVTLNFGTEDFPNLINGFLERAPEASTRWIGTIVADDPNAGDWKWLTGVVHLPPTNAAALKIQVRARAPRDHVRFQVKNGSQVLGNATLSQSFGDYSFQIDPTLLRPDSNGYQLELVVQATPDGAGRVLGAELESLRATAP